MHAVLKASLAFVLVAFNLNLALAGSNGTRYPQHPDAQLTPGEVCHKPTQWRYPERIAYCSRDVDTSEKKDIIKMYDRERGYEIGQMNRAAFKIDHYIPLCMGGSNERDNLWPQHQSVYVLTDPMEPVLCDKMAKGKLKQAEAIELIKKGKADFDQIDGIIKYVNSL